MALQSSSVLRGDTHINQLLDTGFPRKGTYLSVRRYSSAYAILEEGLTSQGT